MSPLGPGLGEDELLQGLDQARALGCGRQAVQPHRFRAARTWPWDPWETGETKVSSPVHLGTEASGQGQGKRWPRLDKGETSRSSSSLLPHSPLLVSPIYCPYPGVPVLLPENLQVYKSICRRPALKGKGGLESVCCCQSASLEVGRQGECQPPACGQLLPALLPASAQR